MKHPERVEDYLEHIAQAIERVVRYIQNVADVESLRQNVEKQDAVVRNLIVIGEAAAKILNMAPSFAASHSGLPWMEMRGIRNKVVHEYFDVDWAVVWDTVRNELPPVKQQIDRILFDHRLGLDQAREREDEPKRTL